MYVVVRGTWKGAMLLGLTAENVVRVRPRSKSDNGSLFVFRPNDKITNVAAQADTIWPAV